MPGARTLHNAYSTLQALGPRGSPKGAPHRRSTLHAKAIRTGYFFASTPAPPPSRFQVTASVSWKGVLSSVLTWTLKPTPILRMVHRNPHGSFPAFLQCLLLIFGCLAVHQYIAKFRSPTVLSGSAARLVSILLSQSFPTSSRLKR